MKIAAIVVTFNRKDLLLENLEALKNQTKPVDAIYIVDNNSTDSTQDLLFQKGYLNYTSKKENSNYFWRSTTTVYSANDSPITVYYLHMNENLGGAGGFFEGIKAAYKDGYYWFWLMDDDTIPEIYALEKLLEKLEMLKEINVGFACSKVLWKDRTVHKMNVPIVLPNVNGIPFNFYEEKNVLLVSSASFVSLIVSRDVVKSVGLPIKEFFIWVDDVEFTSRITKNKMFGIYVKDSIVVHKTQSNYSASDTYNWRFYYNVRNWLWFTRLHRKKTRYWYELIKTIIATYKVPKEYKIINLKACIDSMIKLPKVEFPED